MPGTRGEVECSPRVAMLAILATEVHPRLGQAVQASDSTELTRVDEPSPGGIDLPESLHAVGRWQ